MPTLLVLGATSDMARATALAFGNAGWNVQLAGRDTAMLDLLARDFTVRTGMRAETFPFDAMQPDAHTTLWESLPEKPDAVLCAVGLLGDQEKARHDTALADAILRVNFTGLVPILSLAADAFEQRGNGLIIGISSVAGDRGRASNYVYGSAKAGFTAFLSGLRNRLARKGVHVLTVKPGFAYTAMTEGLPLPPPLTASPEDVGAAIFKAVAKKRNVVYVKPCWRLIMGIIRHIPECVFKRLSL